MEDAVYGAPAAGAAAMQWRRLHTCITGWKGVVARTAGVEAASMLMVTLRVTEIVMTSPVALVSASVHTNTSLTHDQCNS